MTTWEQYKQEDDFDVMFNYFYDLIHEQYRQSWNNYFRMIFGVYDFANVESTSLEDLR